MNPLTILHFRAVSPSLTATLVRMEFVAAFGAGLIAGLALAVPLGAIGVLLIHEGASRGFRGGAPAAAAVASVDMLYGVAAVSAGAVLAPVVAAGGPWPRIVGGAALVALAASSLLRLSRSRDSRTSRDAVGSAADATAGRVTPPHRRFVLFVALTAVNPATLVYFAAIVTAVPGVSSSVTVAALFVAGVTVASITWQLLLVLAGAALRWRAGERLRRVTALVGNGAVAALGAVMIMGALL